MDDQEFSVSVYESHALYQTAYDHAIIDFRSFTDRDAARKFVDDAISAGRYVKIQIASPDTGEWVDVQYAALVLAPAPRKQRVILFAWQGYWAPAGPDHGRGCVFSSEARALAWAREEYDAGYFDERHFRFLPVPAWGDPHAPEPEPEPEPEPPAPADLREARTFRFDLYEEATGPCVDSFQIRGREQARQHANNLDAFHGPGQTRIFATTEQDWREIQRADLADVPAESYAMSAEEIERQNERAEHAEESAGMTADEAREEREP